MRFDSLDYFVFLAFALVFYWGTRHLRVVRLLGLVALGTAFYGTLAPTGPDGRQLRYVALMLGAATVDYWAANQIAKTEDERKRKAWLVTSIVVNLGLLGTFKYWRFAVESIHDASVMMGHEVSLPILRLALPVGISFYTFETMSYTIDVYRRQLKPAKSLLEFVLFISFFPKLVAGPIVRASDFLPQIRAVPAVRRQQISEGLFLIGTGLVKKVVFANYVGVNMVDRVFRNPELYTGAETVVGLYAFTLQIFCDFSGYTDMARGSAKLFGIELGENFDRPYKATSIAEFWRHWHMTLSTWLRDYLYHPLGGSRVGGARAYFNLWLTMFLIGLWHGAKWTFVLYGTLQGLAMVIHRFWTRHGERLRFRGKLAWLSWIANWEERSPESKLLYAFKVACTMQFVVFTRILFRSPSFAAAGQIVERILHGRWTVANVPNTVWLALALGFAAHYTPKGWYADLRERFVKAHPALQAAALVVVALVVRRAATSEVVPFIYEVF